MRTTVQKITFLVVIVTTLPGVAVLFAHTHGPPVPSPPPRPAASIRHVAPLRWSWLHWWEANRDAYLAPLVQGRRTQDRQDAGADALRGRVVDALVQGLADPDHWPRAASALALGLMREASALPALEDLARKDGSPTVRAQALLAIGMIGSPDAQRFVLNTQYSTDTEFTAAIFGLGESDGLVPGAQSGLARLAGDRMPISNAAIWSLRQHSHPDASRVARQTLMRRPSPWTASLALLTLGRSSDVDAHRAIGEVAVLSPASLDLPCFALLESIKQQKAWVIGEAQTEGGRPMHVLQQEWRRAHQRLARLAPPGMQLGLATPPGADVPAMVGGIEDIYMARIRSAAVIALGDVTDPHAITVLRGLFNEKKNDFNVIPKCFAAIGLGRLGATAALKDLISVVDARTARQTQRKELVESPLRGFAAIALGLYARPVETPQGRSDRSRYEQAVRVLADRMTDTAETDEMRCACAIALGLTRRTEVLKGVINFAGTLTADDMPLVGYVLLARAMLGDQMLLKPVSNLLALGPHRDETTTLLSRRAAVLALGLQGKREVVPTLVRAWDEVYYVNREAIRALALCGAAGVGDAVVPRLQQSTNPYERAYMAQILGRLFAEWPPPLTDFLVESNFPLRDEMLQSYRAISNEFFSVYLMGQFDQPWY